MARLSEKAQKKRAQYNIDFKKRSYKRYRLDVRYDNTEIIEKLDSVPNKNKYLQDLIKADIEKDKKG